MLKIKNILLISLLLFILISGLYYAATNSITSDELTHITSGYINLRFNDYRFNVEHPPLVKQLAALPLLLMKLSFPFSVYSASTRPDDIVDIQSAFLFKVGNNLDLMLLVSRIPNILISVLLGIFVYIYSKRLNGQWAGIISLALFAFSPSFLGHSPLVTTDTAVSCFYLITVYFLMRFFESKENKFLTLTGMAFGLALISKFSALILIPVVYMLVTLSVFYCFKDSDYARLKNYIFILPLLPLACSYKSSFKFIAPALFTFIFFSIFLKEKSYSRKIKYVCAVLMVILTIAFIFIIVDYTNFKWFPFHGATKAYFKGFSSFEGHSKGGQGFSYLLGMDSQKGWWYYFPLAFIFKEPAALLAIFLLGLASLFFKKEDAMTRLCLLVPPLVYLLVAMFMNKVNIGIRHILPVYPFVYIIAGYSVFAARRVKYVRYLVALLAILLVFDVLSSYPAHISYFNRLAGGTDGGYKLLGDSNLAWGQDWKRLKAYLDKNNIKEVAVRAAFSFEGNCNYYGICCRPLTPSECLVPGKGFYVLEATELTRDDVKWARKISPIHRVGGSLLVYNISDKELDSLGTR